MQTEQRTKKEDGTTPPRRERPRQFDAGVHIQGETGGGPQYAEGWGQQPYQAYPPQQNPAYPPFQAYTWGQGAPHQSVGFMPPNQPQFAPSPAIGFGAGYGMPFGNPLANLAPTLSYGLAGLADLVYRGVALATSQGQALINTVGPMQGGVGVRREQPVAWPSARLPATDIVDEGGELVCQVELPGVKPENVEVSCFGRGLLVTATAEPEIDLGALVQAERGLEPTYRRAINLPVPVQPSGAKATLRDGILTVNLPKANPTEAPRRIPVN